MSIKRNERLVQFYFRYISSFITPAGAIISYSCVFYRVSNPHQIKVYIDIFETLRFENRETAVLFILAAFLKALVISPKIVSFSFKKPLRILKRRGYAKCNSSKF